MIRRDNAWVNFSRSEAMSSQGSIFWFPEPLIEGFSYLADLDKSSNSPTVPTKASALSSGWGPHG